MLLSYQLKDTEPFALITDPSFAEVLGEVIGEVPLRRLVVHTPAPGDHDFTGLDFGPAFKGLDIVAFAQLGASDPPAPGIDRGPFDLANIVYTSGTTGPSKGVVQPFRWMNHYGFPARQLTSSDDVIYAIYRSIMSAARSFFWPARSGKATPSGCGTGSVPHDSGIASPNAARPPVCCSM
jgi:crotonobetaine/carnitine-CoA ligase